MATLPKLPGIPSISPVKDATVAAILRPMKESLEILGSSFSGNALPNGIFVGGGSGGGSSGGTTTDPGDYNPATDTTIPPAPTNLTIGGAFANIILQWDDPGTPTYRNAGYTEIWRSPTNVLGNAVLIGSSPGAIYTDSVGTRQSYYYWIRFRSQADIVGPYNSSVGTLGQTALDPAYLLEVLTGSITQTQLYSTLSEEIGQIELNRAAIVVTQTAITNEATVRATADSSLSQQINTVSAITNANTAAIQVETTARTDADSAFATQITVVETATANNTAAIQNEITARTNADSAFASQISTLQVTVDENTASIQEEATTRADADSAFSQQITTLQVTVDENTASIQEEATTRADADGTLFAQYTIKLDVNGYVSGFGLASTPVNGTPYSDFIIRADRFSIANPSGPSVTPTIPFIVTTTTSVIGGETVPPGVYIKDAFIQNGTISNAKIADLAVDDAKIASLGVDKLTAGSISAGEYVKSSNYSQGATGWYIGGNGVAEFGAASIRGQLTASQIDSRNLTIKDSAGNVLFGSGTNLSTSYINGLGSLATSNSVNWNTQLTNIPSFGGFAYISSITSANISTYIASAAIGEAYIANAAITEAKIANASISAAKIQDGEVTNAKIGSFIQSTNYVAGSAGWSINKSGGAEFNDITVRSGQITGALMQTFKINSYSGIYVEINTGNPVSSTNGPYYLNGTGEPLYLVYNSPMPAPATAAHKIAVVVNVQAVAGGSSKDLGVKLFINSFFTGGSGVTASEVIAYNTDSGTYGISTNAAGVSSNSYATEVPCMIFVTGYNAAYTIQNIDGLAFGVR